MSDDQIRAAFRAGFLANCSARRGGTNRSAVMGRVWTFGQHAPAGGDLEPEAYAAWLKTLEPPPTPALPARALMRLGDGTVQRVWVLAETKCYFRVSALAGEYLRIPVRGRVIRRGSMRQVLHAGVRQVYAPATELVGKGFLHFHRPPEIPGA